MRVHQRTNDGIILRGIPNGATWMAFAAVLGLGLIGVGIALGTYAVTQSLWGMLLPAAGALAFGLFFLIWGSDKLLSVERLELSGGSCLYTLRSRIRGERDRIQFERSRIDSVSVSLHREHRDRPGEATGHEVERVEANLRITGPRRKILLDSTENGNAERVLALASAVAEAIGAPLVDERGQLLDAADAASPAMHA